MEKQEQILSIVKDLENKAITTHQATELILVLFDVINCPLCGGEMAFVHPENCMTEGCPNCVF